MDARTCLRSVAVLAIFGLMACGQSSTGQPGATQQPAASGGGSAAPQAAAGPGVTARTAFATARQRALAWKPDARLEKAATIWARKDGKVPAETTLGVSFTWQFIFSSASAQKAWMVETNGTEVKESEAAGWMLFNPISESFVDSDAAISEAARGGYTLDEYNPMELVIQHGSEKLGEPMWVIGQVGGDQYAISANTGKFVRKLAS